MNLRFLLRRVAGLHSERERVLIRSCVRSKCTRLAIIQSAAERRTPKTVNTFPWTAALRAALDFPNSFLRLTGTVRPTDLVTRRWGESSG